MVENQSETEPTNHHYRAATLHKSVVVSIAVSSLGASNIHVLEPGVKINGVYYFVYLHNTYHFYRAMHVVLARYCYRMSSVRLSVCPSVCNRR